MVELTEAHRIRKLAYAYVTTRDRLKTLAAEHTAQVSAERQRLEQALYGDSDPEGLRTALDSASARIRNREQAAAALRRAERVGDKVAALAAFNVAAEHGWSERLEVLPGEAPGCCRSARSPGRS